MAIFSNRIKWLFLHNIIPLITIIEVCEYNVCDRDAESYVFGLRAEGPGSNSISNIGFYSILSEGNGRGPKCIKYNIK